uniref:Superoxide dismutase copper/zinc binding domain-containing protein n=1 Tax=Knipowitschia caucasica TaxID=637954 RepID=A0AAV2LWY0_KNICA
MSPMRVVSSANLISFTESWLELRGFDKNSIETKAVHIHQFGDLSSGFGSPRGHYYPHNRPTLDPLQFAYRSNIGVEDAVIYFLQRTLSHLEPAGSAHPGDFGNFLIQDRRIIIALQSQAKPFGEHLILCRAVVNHLNQDDQGQGGNDSSLKNGNAGHRVGCCCFIGVTSCAPWNKHSSV